AATMGERASKQVLQRYGIPAVKDVLLQPAEIAALTAAPLAFPVALKVDSPDVPHKTEAGGVKLGIHDLAELKQAARDMVDAVRRHKTDAHITGLLVQEMATGLEVIA